MKLAYHYAPDTFLFVGTSQVHKVAGYDDYMLPQLATWVETPDFNDKTQRLKFIVDGQEWHVESKHAKVTAYHKQTQVLKEFDDKSLIDNDYTIKEPLPYSIWQNDDWVQQINLLLTAKHEQINRWRSQQEADTNTIVEVNGHKWDAGPEARARIDSTLLTEQMPPYWTDADNVDHSGMTLGELKAVKVAISALGFQTHHRQRTMKKEIEAITSFVELEAYAVGWTQS
ncbi:DUF4376 domain-containing protein [Vibrio europaeus]|uniref:DUF4376 domain-containing protein n=1 Tax=Vibrio europaeus TaxID=300876 RepID=UPI00233F68DB|nr:DUF4376 domain-containing protein [Vibrio europaeus]MDC5753871.1 DUF4376 domain-containing protein [Vibrio europaeus]MDC5776783.1 DUF4376 domain-containing protein [Vibrio europaeus]MDC5796799.1 DUF4376 domain-containing protein [Vibrio europaeus]MDC5801796.1 DUF4376 domain-containing protein [Vibrio europaeus]MDC5815769.1 DUF4376 domain-containing protein [Vibrio europaeus]